MVKRGGEKLKLARASTFIMREDAIYGDDFTNTLQYDTLSLPKEYNKIVDQCRFYYKREPLAATVLNKIIDFTITQLTNGRGKCAENEYAVFKALAPTIREFFLAATLEYLLSGMALPHYEWETIKGSDLSPDLDSRRKVTVPTLFWLRDPQTVILKRSIIIPSQIQVYVKIDQQLIDFIRTGKLNGKSEPALLAQFKKNYPEFVEQILAMDTRAYMDLEVLDPTIRPIFGKMLVNEANPIPYLYAGLEAMKHKRNLRKMDYAIAARVQSAIQLIQLGNDEFPTTDEADFDHIKQQMNVREQVDSNRERLFQLFADHTLKIEWVYPDTTAMLNSAKYSEVDDDIMAALGFPRTLVVGETLRSSTMQADLATFSPMATMENIRIKLLDWLKVLYREIKEKNNFKSTAEPQFTPMKLNKLVDLMTTGATLYKEGSLSRTSRLEAAGYDVEVEADRKKEEQDLYQSRGLDDFPPVPFSPTAPGTPKAAPTAKPIDKVAAPGDKPVKPVPKVKKPAAPKVGNE